jgi:hypothetical protein
LGEKVNSWGNIRDNRVGCKKSIGNEKASNKSLEDYNHFNPKASLIGYFGKWISRKAAKQYEGMQANEDEWYSEYWRYSETGV